MRVHRLPHATYRTARREVRQFFQDSLALLKILAQSSKSLKAGQFKSAKSAFSDLRKRIKELKLKKEEELHLQLFCR